MVAQFKHLLKEAQKHHLIVSKYGRYPTRNRALGRVSNEAEEEYLKNAPAWDM